MLNRRTFLRLISSTAAIAVATPAFSKRQSKPNLLIIHTDEHNFRTLGCYRKNLPEAQAYVWGKDAVVATPNIDWLADNGAICTKFYATTPVCSPSRSAFVSGRYPQNTPVTTNGIPLNDEVVTFSEILRRQGYATGYAGKWHLDGQGKPQWAPKRKFGFADNRYMFNRGHWKQLEDTPSGPRVKARNEKGAPSYNVKGADEKCFATDFLADKTIDFIKGHKNEPFCFMVSIPDPHGPNTVRPPYDTMFDDLEISAPATFSKPHESVPGWAQKQKKSFAGAYIARYFGMVKCIDDNVGKILDVLRTHKLIDSTIVIFTADHGDMCGEHARDNKGVPYESSAKIPFVLYYPNKVKAGTVITRSLGCVDFLPTIISLMGFRTAGKEQGRDASELFTKADAAKGWKDITFMRGTGSGGSANWLAAVTARYKLVFSPDDNPWLFDLEKDPDELTNFFGDPAYRRTVRFLAKDLVAYCRTYNDHYSSDPKIKSDLAWAAEGTDKYVPAVIAKKPRTDKKTRNRKVRKTRRTKNKK